MAGNRERYKVFLQKLNEKMTLGNKLDFASSEAYKLLCANIMFAMPEEKACRVIGVTSSRGGEGKSTTALNLAYMLAEDSQRVLLIESDMRRPSLAKRLDMRMSPGLSNLLTGQIELDRAIQRTWLQDNLFFIGAGDILPNPSKLLGSRSMRLLLDAAAGSFDDVILDLPPVTGVSDALVASKVTDGMIVVVRQDYASRRALAEAMRRLEFAEAKILGFVLTRSDVRSGGKKYKGCRCAAPRGR